MAAAGSVPQRLRSKSAPSPFEPLSTQMQRLENHLEQQESFVFETFFPTRRREARAFLQRRGGGKGTTPFCALSQLPRTRCPEERIAIVFLMAGVVRASRRACCSIMFTEVYAELRLGEEAKTERLLRSLKFTLSRGKSPNRPVHCWTYVGRRIVPFRCLILPSAAVALANDLMLGHWLLTPV